MQNTLSGLTTPGDVWSDFVGTGSDASSYENGEASPKNAQELGIDVSDGFKSGASYSGPCTKMDASSTYQLDGTACSSTARFICIKPRKLLQDLCIESETKIHAI